MWGNSVSNFLYTSLQTHQCHFINFWSANTFICKHLWTINFNRTSGFLISCPFFNYHQCICFVSPVFTEEEKKQKRKQTERGEEGMQRSKTFFSLFRKQDSSRSRSRSPSRSESILGNIRLGWPYVPFSQDASWPGFLYCFDSKYLEMRFENIRNRVIHRSVCTRKQSQILDILGYIEILARTRPGKMARMVTLY